MKKLVPDPPIPFFSIIADLSAEDALAEAGKLMATLNRTLAAYFSAQAHMRGFLLENVAILAQLTCALVTHARTKEAPV